MCNLKKLEYLLDKDENIELVVEPKKGLMFHSNDLFKIIVGGLFLIFGFVTAYATEHFLFLIFGLFVLYQIGKAIFVRYENINGMKYILSNKRILFVKNGIIKKEKLWKEINQVTYENSGNDSGYIILGENEPLFAGRGISFSEDKYILDNLNNYSQVSDLIKKLTNKNYTQHWL